MEEGQHTSRRVPIASTASVEEVSSAFYGLRDEEQVALERYAEWRIIRIGVGANARTPDDLLQEVFGKDKSPCRLVYGVASLPLGTPVELELIFAVEE